MEQKKPLNNQPNLSGRADPAVTSATLPCQKQTISIEIGGEFQLPDYRPEMKKILTVSANAMPPESYENHDSVEFSGEITYYVTYVGPDGAVYCAPLEGEYAFGAAIDAGEDATAEKTVSCRCATRDLSARLQSARRVAVRGKMTADVTVFENVSTDCICIGAEKDEETVVRKTEKKTVAHRYGARSEQFHLKDTILPDKTEKELRVICADGRVFVKDVTASAGAASCRGDVLVHLLLAQEEGGEPFAMWRKIPFTQEIAIEGLPAGCPMSACGYCKDISVTFGDDESTDIGEVSDKNRMEIEVGCLIETTGQENESLTCTTDLFSLTKDCRIDARTVALPSALATGNANFSIGDTYAYGDVGFPAGAEILDCDGEAEIVSMRCESGKLIMEGVATICCLIKKSDGEYGSWDTSMPIRFETEAEKMSADGKLSVDGNCAELLSVRARTDNERISLSAEVGVSYSVSQVGEYEMPQSCEFLQDLPVRRSEMIVCYPAADETLWEIAKRYHISPMELAEINRIEQSGETRLPRFLLIQ